MPVQKGQSNTVGITGFIPNSATKNDYTLFDPAVTPQGPAPGGGGSGGCGG